MLLTESTLSRTAQSLQAPLWLVVIGANTGGPQALLELLPRFPADFPGSIVVMQQMRPGFTRVLVDQLSHVCKLPVHEPEDGQALRSGRILVAPSAMRLTIGSIDIEPLPDHSVLLESMGESPESRQTRIDAAMASAAQAFGQRCIGVILSGLGSDGVEGMRAIRSAGGVTIAQDEASSVVHSMPSASIDAGVVGEVLPLWGIADRILSIVGGDAYAAAA
jgi:two-component system chemotaxis response regulator CheB